MKNPVNTLMTFVTQPLAPEDVAPRLRWKLWLQTSLRMLRIIGHDIYEGTLTLRATSLAYITLLSFVPMLAVSFAMLKVFDGHNMMGPLLLELLKPLGPKSVDIVNQVIGFVENTQVTLLGTIGLTFLIYTTLELMQKTEEALNETWRVKKIRPLMQRISSYLSILLVGPVLLFAAIGMMSSLIDTEIIMAAFQIEPIYTVIRMLALLIPYMLFIGAFTVFYVFAPNTSVNFGAALLGGVVAALLWQGTGWVFAEFVASSIRYTAIYSAFATLIVFMMWLYMSWLILLIGASIAFYYQHPIYLSLKGNALQSSVRTRERLALHILLLVGQRFYQHGARWSASALAEQLAVPQVLIEPVLAQLTQAGLLHEDSDLSVYSPGQPFESTPLHTVFLALHHADDNNDLNVVSIPHAPVIDDVIQRIDQAAAATLNGLTLKSLMLQEFELDKVAEG